MSKDDSPAAFPLGASEYGGHGSQAGMTLRDYFAAQVLAGRFAIPGQVDVEYDAKLAYQMADAMLAARDA